MYFSCPTPLAADGPSISRARRRDASGGIGRSSSRGVSAAGAAYADRNLVFAAPLGGPIDPSVLRRAWDKIAREAGVPGMHFHDLRHVHASLMLAQGEHPKVVAGRLGHSSTKITMDTYSHLGPTMQAEAAERLDALIFQSDRAVP